jgi:hypothetical protein
MITNYTVTHKKPWITALLTQTVLQTWKVAIPADDTNKSHRHAHRKSILIQRMSATTRSNIFRLPVRDVRTKKYIRTGNTDRQYWLLCHTASDIHGRVFGTEGWRNEKPYKLSPWKASMLFNNVLIKSNPIGFTKHVAGTGQSFVTKPKQEASWRIKE